MKQVRVRVDEFNGLLTRIEQSRIRLRWKMYLRGAGYSLTTAIGFFFVLELLNRFVWRLPLSRSETFAIAAALFCLGLIWAIIFTHYRQPSLLETAGRVERKLDLDERLSTILELKGKEKGNNESLLYQALLEDVRGFGTSIKPKELVMVTPTWGDWSVLTLLSAATCIFFLFVLSPPFVPEVTRDTEPSSAIQSENIRTIAEFISRDAEITNDPYLRALAEGFESLSERVDNLALNSESVEDELGRLLDHVDRAYGDDHTSTSNLADVMPLLREMLRVPTKTDALTIASGTDVSRGEEAVLSESADMGEEPPRSLNELLAQLETGRHTQQRESGVADPLSEPPLDSGPETNNQLPTGEASGFYGEVNPLTQATIDRERVLFEQFRVEGQRAGEAIGLADEAGSSTRAGEGSQPLFLEDGAELPPEWEAAEAEDIELPFNEDASRRIRVDAPPDEQFTDIFESDVAQGEWRRAGEVPVDAALLGLSKRDVASRYFLSLNQAKVDASNP